MMLTENKVFCIPSMSAGFLRNAYEYIKARRPYELMTLAILNEARYDILDAEAGMKRNLEVN